MIQCFFFAVGEAYDLDFSPEWAIVVTWENVDPYGSFLSGVSKLDII